MNLQRFISKASRNLEMQALDFYMDMLNEDYYQQNEVERNAHFADMGRIIFAARKIKTMSALYEFLNGEFGQMIGIADAEDIDNFCQMIEEKM